MAQTIFAVATRNHSAFFEEPQPGGPNLGPQTSRRHSGTNGVAGQRPGRIEDPMMSGKFPQTSKNYDDI